MTHERLIRHNGRLYWELDGTRWPAIHGGAEPAPEPMDVPPVDETGGFPPPTLSPEDAAAVSGTPPSTESVQIGGQQFQVPSDFAQAWRQEQQQSQGLRDEFQATRQELESMRGVHESLRRVFAPETQGPDLATQIYTDPNAAFQNLEDRIVSRMQGMYQQDQTQQRFWSDFYTEHEELRNFDGLVRTTLQSNPALQQTPNTVEGRAALAKEVRSAAMAIAKQFGGNRTPQLRAVESGGGTSRTAPSTEPTGEDEGETRQPMSINQAMKNRRDGRRQARRTQTA